MTTSPPLALPPDGRQLSPVLQAWREETLVSVVRITLLASVPAMVAASLAAARRGQALYLLAPLASLLLLAWLAFDRRLPYRGRAYGILAVLGVSGASTLLNLGMDGVGRLYVIAVIFLAAVLLPWREVMGAWAAVGLGAGAVLTGLAMGVVGPAPGAPPAPSRFEAVLTSAVAIVWFALAVGFPVVAIIARLTGALAAAEDALAERDAANMTLEYTVEERTDELRRSQALLQGLLDNSPVAIFVKDLEGRYLLTNSYMHRVHGLSAEGMRARRDVELFGASAEPWRSHERAVLATGSTVAAEVVTPHADGPHTYYEIKFPLRDAAGAVTAVGGIAVDITASREAQLELQRQEALLRTISDALPEGFLYQVGQLRDASYVGYTYVSRGVEPILGLSPEQIVADKTALQGCIHPDDRALIRAADAESARALAMFDVEARLQKVDGSYGWFKIRSVPQPLPDGVVLWNGVCLEVTQLKQAQLALQQANGLLRRRIGELAALNQLAQALMGWTDLPEAIRAVGPLLHGLFRAEHVAIWLRTERGDALTQLAAAARGEAAPGAPKVSLRQTPVARAALQSRQVQICEDGRADPALLPAHYPLGSTHGAALVQPILVRNTPIGLLVVRMAPGATIAPSDVELAQTVAGLLSAAIENGRLMRQTMAAAAAEERRRLARELHDSVTQQLAGLTLLASAWAKQAARGQSAEVGDWLGQVEAIALQALKEMRLLIYQLRSDELEAQGLAAALRRRAEAVEGRSGVQVRLELDERLPRLGAEIELELFAIAQEALNNAARHAQARAVTVSLRREAGALQLAVSDDGRGFDPAAPSWGLGMTTMRERAARIGGACSVTSARGRGTTVAVTLPLEGAPRRVAGRAASARSRQ